MKNIADRIVRLMKLAFRDSKKILLCSLLIFFLIRVLTPVLGPLTMAWIFDALEQGDIGEVGISLVSVAAVTIFNGGLLYLLLVYLDTWADLITQNSNMKLIRNLIEKPYGSLRARYENGDLVNRVSESSRTVFSLALAPCNAFAKIITCIYFAFMLRRLSWQIWCVIACVFVVVVLITKVQLQIETRFNTSMQKAYGEKEIITREIIHNVDFYKMTGLDGYIWDVYKKQRDQMFDVGWKQALNSALFALLQDVAALCGKVILLLFVYPVRLAGLLTAGVVSTIPVICDNLMEQLKGIRAVIAGLPGQLVPVKRYYEVMENGMKNGMKNGNQKEEKESAALLRLDGVSLTLNGVSVLRDIHLQISAGEKVAVIGSNGSGKSTLLRTLLGMYDGDITGNVSCFAAQLDSKASCIPTGHQLFNGTASENIRSSGDDDREMPLEEMWLYPDIAEVINHKKDALSDGQKQMVNILRGCYKGADFLFADEVTSSIDPDRHRRVMEELVNQCDTVICITHSRDDLPLFHRVIVMENGRIAADDVPDRIGQTAAYQRWLSGGNER